MEQGTGAEPNLPPGFKSLRGEGERCKALLTHHHISQNQLAQRIGLPRMTVSRILKEKTIPTQHWPNIMAGLLMLQLDPNLVRPGALPSAHDLIEIYLRMSPEIATPLRKQLVDPEYQEFQRRMQSASTASQKEFRMWLIGVHHGEKTRRTS